MHYQFASLTKNRVIIAIQSYFRNRRVPFGYWADSDSVPGMDFFQISGSDSLQNCRFRFGYPVLGYLSPTLVTTHLYALKWINVLSRLKSNVFSAHSHLCRYFFFCFKWYNLARYWISWKILPHFKALWHRTLFFIWQSNSHCCINFSCQNKDNF